MRSSRMKGGIDLKSFFSKFGSSKPSNNNSNGATVNQNTTQVKEELIRQLIDILINEKRKGVIDIDKLTDEINAYTKELDTIKNNIERATIKKSSLERTNASNLQNIDQEIKLANTLRKLIKNYGEDITNNDKVNLENVVPEQPAEVVSGPAEVVSGPAEVVSGQPAEVVSGQPAEVVSGHIGGKKSRKSKRSRRRKSRRFRGG